MRTDLDRRLATTLRAHAGDDVDPAPIVAHARRRGGRIRLRRRMTAGAAAALCAVVAAAALVRAPHAPDPAPAAPPAALALPAAPGEPGALARPEAVGADPRVVHFAADDVVEADYATWRTGRGTESVEFLNKAEFVLATTEAALDAAPRSLRSAGRPQPPADVRVADRPGTAWSDAGENGGPSLWSVRWQPGDGLWAQLDIFAAGRDEATAAAAQVTFTEARRCVVPFRLETLPAGARVVGCAVTIGTAERNGFAEASLVVGDDAGRWLTIRAERTPEGVQDRGGDLVAGPYRPWYIAEGTLEMLVRPCLVDLFLIEAGSHPTVSGRGYAERDALTVLGGYRPAASLDDPAAW